MYDLSPANDYLYPIGFGLHHSGVEIMGVEYSFGSGSGIFEMPPKQAPNAKFRTQIELGSYDGGSKELNMALDDMRHGSGKFGPADYNLITNNCNHFANGLVWRLLRKTIPPHINRLADLGNCCSCLLPRQLLQQDAPVGGTTSGSGLSGGRIPNQSSMQRGSGSGVSSSIAFTGKGQSLGGGSSTASTASSSSSSGLFSRLAGSSPGGSNPSSSTEDGLKDRREKARMAALARLERSQQLQQQTDETKQQ